MSMVYGSSSPACQQGQSLFQRLETKELGHMWSRVSGQTCVCGQSVTKLMLNRIRPITFQNNSTKKLRYQFFSSNIVRCCIDTADKLVPRKQDSLSRVSGHSFHRARLFQRTHQGHSVHKNISIQNWCLGRAGPNR